jgi:hypothetical protein
MIFDGISSGLFNGSFAITATTTAFTEVFTYAPIVTYTPISGGPGWYVSYPAPSWAQFQFSIPTAPPKPLELPEPTEICEQEGLFFEDC